ncbi:MAG: efflux RND transporter periplasmic adaptor subunit [Bacteroides sp.]|nr:efflux RND transporter periplasmic adaptor subunit [Bacteroides sp.]
MKRMLYILLALPLLTGCKEKKEMSRAMPTPEISVAKPLVKDITLTKDYPGYLTSQQTVNLVARVNGTLQSASFTPGSRVKKGQILFVIEPTIYKDNVSQAEAALRTAKVQLEYARNNYSRMTEALKSDAVSRIQVLQAESTMNEGIAAVKNAEAVLNSAQTNLTYCYIRAPFDGTVSNKTVDVGNYISGAAQPVTLATIYQDNRMYTYFNVADNQWLSMLMSNENKGGLPRDVIVRLGKDGLQTYPAQLDYLSPNVDMSTGTLNVRANLDNPKGILKSGLYVSITLPYAQQPNALLVQDASIGTDQLGKYVYLVNDSNRVDYRHIITGQLISDTLRQVISGLSPNDKYVTKALMKVREGMQVKPVLE